MRPLCPRKAARRITSSSSAHSVVSGTSTLPRTLSACPHLSCRPWPCPDNIGGSKSPLDGTYAQARGRPVHQHEAALSPGFKHLGPSFQHRGITEMRNSQADRSHRPRGDGRDSAAQWTNFSVRANTPPHSARRSITVASVRGMR